MRYSKEQYVWILLRIGLGWIFLWAFFDKVLGLGFATTPDKSWLTGTSPTFGFLKFGTHGLFKSFFETLAGNPAVDWLFMTGLLFVGLSLLLGIAVRLGSYSGSLLMFLIWLSLFPPQNNPFADEHLIYVLVFIGLATVEAGQWFGLGKWWNNTKLVKKYPILK